MVFVHVNCNLRFIDCYKFYNFEVFVDNFSISIILDHYCILF